MAISYEGSMALWLLLWWESGDIDDLEFANNIDYSNHYFSGIPSMWG